MSTRTQMSTDTTRTATRVWSGAIAGGLVAGVGMGLIMHFVMNAMPLIGALYGQPTLVAGWVAHLFHSVVFALLFAVVVTRTSIREFGILRIIGVGVVYGLLLEFVAAGVVLPLWANAVGAASLPVPFIVSLGFVTHVLYGLLLGAVFGYVVTRKPAMEAVEPSERAAT